MSSPYFPPEILDYIADLLHDKSKILGRCCLVSKSWVPRTRKHLFADISFRSPVDLKLWKKMFPDRSTSPAHHTRTLLVGCPEVVTVADAGEGGWIQTFSRVVKLVVRGGSADASNAEVSLTPFHGFSPVLKSLRVSLNSLQNSQIFDLISSLPVLEDMTVSAIVIETDDVLNLDVSPSAVQPSTSPPFTGTLDLTLALGVEHVTRRLLGLSSGVHFRRLLLPWSHEGDLRWLNALIAGCSGTLECLTVAYYLRCDSGPASIDLSKATKLRDAVFLLSSPNVRWITLALRTITPQHRYLQRISIHMQYHLALPRGADIRRTIGESDFNRWLDLDRLLVQFWESRLIRPKIVYTPLGGGMSGSHNWVEYLLPEMTERGIIDWGPGRIVG